VAKVAIGPRNRPLAVRGSTKEIQGREACAMMRREKFRPSAKARETEDGSRTSAFDPGRKRGVICLAHLFIDSGAEPWQSNLKETT
jgi:hypothetical protein